MSVTASLVLYHNPSEQFEGAIKSFLASGDGHLYIVDNSTAPLTSVFFDHPRVRYLFAGQNLGFGRAHNLALNSLVEDSDFHLFLNPDIVFEGDVLPILQKYMMESGAGAVMPRIEYPDGRIQNLCKMLPTPFDLIVRRFVPVKSLRRRVDDRYVISEVPQDKPSVVPSLSGCFLLVRRSAIEKVGGFDERFFMYMEDIDLVRRVGDFFPTVYYPMVVVVHAFEKGSYKNFRLLRYHVQSAYRYFSKWGWFWDEGRRRGWSAIN